MRELLGNRLAKWVCTALLLSQSILGQAADKRIYLRAETILTSQATEPAAALPTGAGQVRLAGEAVAEPVSGLFLVQFEDGLQPGWRQALRGLGVELVRYVPQDAFIVRLNNVRLAQLKALPFVRWVGAFRPDYKLHPRLRAQLQTQPPQEPAQVSLLVSPLATPDELAQLRARFQQVNQAAVPRLGVVLRGTLPAGQLDALARSEAILWIESAPRMRLYDEVASRIVAGDGSPHRTAMMDLGYDGQGVTVAVADSGLDSGDPDFMHPDLAGRVRAMLFYGGLEDAADEHSHGTHVAGIIAGNGATGEIDENGFLYGLGVAPGAELVVQRLFDGLGRYYPPPTFETLTRDATRLGAEIGSNSWGDDTRGAYDLSAAEFDALVRDADLLRPGDQPYILEFSAGNAGPGYQTVGSPAVAKNVIATGATENNRFNLPLEEFTIYDTGQEAMADFSSRGPCEDGRIKPDLVAPGTWIASLRSIYADDANAWWPISDYYLYQGGTSQAGPHVSGAAAVFVQYFRATHTNATPSPALVKAALINSAVDLDDQFGTGPVPSMDEGWGRVNLPALINGPGTRLFVDQTSPLATGQTFEHRVVVASPTVPLKITLAYTDVPGFPGSPIALVNDLDLEVVGPDGRRYRGNQFDQGVSVPDAPGFDNINNVEAVHLPAPTPGEYVVRVYGRNVVEDARLDTDPVDQDFALVVSGSLASPGQGVLTFDRPAYSAPALITLRLVDHDLAGQATAVVQLRSSTEPGGETVTLRASGSSGVFTGAVATAIGVAQADGRLQIAHGDLIEAIYQDTAPPAIRTFSARADLVPPAITDVHVATRFGRSYVSFNTDELALPTVRYGTNLLNQTVTGRLWATTHELALTNLAPNRTWRFIVIAEDQAGNRATNDNAGASFSFVPTEPPTVLLVDAYTDWLFDVPPLSGYTLALDRLGVSYDVWDATEGVSPSLDVLRGYRCVIWRVAEFNSGESWTPQEQQTLIDYLNGGGSLLVASMEVLSRLEEGGFSNFARQVLQVQSFVPDAGAPRLVGALGEPIGAGIDTPMDYSGYEDWLKELIGMPADVSDTIQPTTNAVPIFFNSTARSAAIGLRAPRPGVDMPGRVVFLATALDAIPLGTGVGNNRAGVLHNILNFLAPPPGNASLVLDSDIYTVPARVIVEVEDPDLEGQGQLTVTAYSPQQPTGVSVGLIETVRRGLFRGSLALVPAATGGAAELVTQPGDTLRVEYRDASANTTLSVTAQIETTPPVISDIETEPGYTEAFVRWVTSEPADALVQFSESPEGLAPTNRLPINFTAYNPTLDTEHELLLTGLLPDRTYYFRVISRDKAGNVAVDDNAGQFYTFTTLTPITPPWTDTLEQGAGDWTVVPVEGSEANWTLGVPGRGVQAHSPPTCWGSNLDGGRLGLAESVLISPGIFLTGGTEAALRFWQNYDFPPGDTEIEYGELWLITNAVTGEYVVLDVIGTIVGGLADSSEGWEQVEYDLTPYLGMVVYVAWHYFVFSGEDLERQGWLIDDVSIEVSSPARGLIQVTNNLSAAVFVLTGPVSRAGQGAEWVLSNAPPGQYVIEFGAVPYYDTPAPQTNMLQAGGRLAFAGHYSFADANANGLPDGWEQDYFGTVDPGRSPAWDSDGDGASDYAEFIAGTNPTNRLSVLQVVAEPPAGPGLTLRWASVVGRAYRIAASDDLVNWVPVTPWRRSNRGGPMSETLSVPAGVPARFFRVEVRP